MIGGWPAGGAWAINEARAAAVAAARHGRDAGRPPHRGRGHGRRAGRTRDPIRLILAVIAAITVLSGAAQLVAPGPILAVLGADSTATTRYLFAIVGMFMVVIGAVTANALRAPTAPTYVLGWAAAQKLGAAAAVGLAVVQGLFAPLALGVAGFDLVTAVLAGLFWLRALDGRRPVPRVA